jgi:hypothetical protein
MRTGLFRLAAFLFPLFLTACGDLPTSTRGAPDVSGAGPMLSGECYLQDGIYRCPPQSPDWGDCDEYHYDCGGDDCIASTIPSAPGNASVQGCTGGGGGGTIGDSDGGGGTGGGGGGSTGSDPFCPDFGCPTAFEEGPLLWGACVLAVLGSTYSIDQVASAFKGWWNAQRAYESALRTLDVIRANPDAVSPEMAEVWTLRVEYTRDRRDDAMAEVSEKTDGSYWGLLGAAAACGAAAFVPTP